MNRHSEESSTLTRPPRPAGAPRSGKQARSAAKRLVLSGLRVEHLAESGQRPGDVQPRVKFRSQAQFKGANVVLFPDGDEARRFPAGNGS